VTSEKSSNMAAERYTWAQASSIPKPGALMALPKGVCPSPLGLPSSPVGANLRGFHELGTMKAYSAC
jgi:hypothetical protein